MLKAISSHVFLNHRLHPGLLDVFSRAGAQGVELFAARQHFDYTSRTHVRELAEWFGANPAEAFSMHAPLWSDTEMGRGGSPAVNVIHPEKSRRIDAMDEIKRALEVAETLPLPVSDSPSRRARGHMGPARAGALDHGAGTSARVSQILSA